MTISSGSDMNVLLDVSGMSETSSAGPVNAPPGQSGILQWAIEGYYFNQSDDPYNGFQKFTNQNGEWAITFTSHGAAFSPWVMTANYSGGLVSGVIDSATGAVTFTVA